MFSTSESLLVDSLELELAFDEAFFGADTLTLSTSSFDESLLLDSLDEEEDAAVVLIATALGFEITCFFTIFGESLTLTVVAVCCFFTGLEDSSSDEESLELLDSRLLFCPVFI